MRRLAEVLRRIADRIDYAGAPKALGLCFTFEPHRGLVINDRGTGCRLWYLGDQEYEKAHSEAGGDLPSPRWAPVAG
jgi:hypothetical protein